MIHHQAFITSRTTFIHLAQFAFRDD